MRHSPPMLAACMLIVAALACGGTGEEGARILDLPQYICPSSTPIPTDVPPPTAIQPTQWQPPGGYVTYTPYPGVTLMPCGGMYCQITNTPFPGGIYSTPGHGIPGNTSTPRPTTTPYPSPTPYSAYTDYPMGAEVHTGGYLSPLDVRLRVAAPAVYPLPDARQVVAWRVEIANVGEEGDPVYNALPPAQMFVAQIADGAGQAQTGYWYPSAEAGQAVGIALDAAAQDIQVIEPGQQVNMRLTAFTPAGALLKIGWALDPYSGGMAEGLQGGNVAYWSMNLPPDGCEGDLGSGAPVPTVLAPTATPTYTPDPPEWWDW